MKTLSAAYRCEFCRKLYELKPAAELHESLCRLNPNNWRPCHNCIHSKKKEQHIFHSITEGYSTSLIFCEKREHFIYPPNKEAKAKRIPMDDIENLPMPIECEFQEKTPFGASIYGEN